MSAYATQERLETIRLEIICNRQGKGRGCMDRATIEEIKGVLLNFFKIGSEIYSGLIKVY